MKKLVLLLLLPLCFKTYAQDEEPEKKAPGFDKEKLFTGGSANVGFSNGATMLGITPQFGYSILDWADVGINFNINYLSQRDPYNSGDKLRQTTFGPGAFVRLFPVDFLFATAQYEYNIMRQKYIPAAATGGNTTDQFTAPSFLIGGGYAGGRYKGSNTYYFLSIMWDVADSQYSPYRDSYGRSNPVIRAGYNIGLFQGKYRR